MNAYRAIESAAAEARDRLDLWSRITNGLGVSSCAEIGVFRGEYAQHVLEHCPSIERYFMIDPWQHLDDWNKPANASDAQFSDIKEEALARTAFASSKRMILQGRTTEVADQVPRHGLDLAYIDGDHTLRGITIDLLRIWPKITNGGILGGDDFCRSVWQHDASFEPTLVFPLAVHFAEARDAVIYGLPHNQFAIVVDRRGKHGFDFRDLTGSYHSTELRDALEPGPRSRRRSPLKRALRGLRRAVSSR